MPRDVSTLPITSDLVRELFRQLYRRDPNTGYEFDTAILSPPHVSGFDESDVRLVMRKLHALGWIRLAREIHMNPPPDPVMWRLTRAGIEQARHSIDDDSWAVRWPVIEEALTLSRIAVSSWSALEYPAYVRVEGNQRIVTFPDCPECNFLADPDVNVFTAAHTALERWLTEALSKPGGAPLRSMHEHDPNWERSELMMVGIDPILAARIRIRAARHELGVSRRQVADAAGVIEEVVAAIETPDRAVQEEMLNRVATALGLTTFCY